MRNVSLFTLWLLFLLALGCVGPDPKAPPASESLPLESSPVVNLVLTPGDGALLVEWESLSTTPVDAFQVYYRKGLPGVPWDGTEAINGPSPVRVEQSTSVTLDGLENGAAYFVSVSQVQGGEESLLSNLATGVPVREVGAQVWVPPGTFYMGAAEGLADPDEEPLHSVYLDGFWMDRYVATNGEFRACVEAGVCGAPAVEWGYLQDITWVEDYFTNPLYDGFPVVFLQYQEAKDYCGWRGMTLPSEAQWEKAARGVREEPGYTWGTLEPTCDIANYNDDGIFCEGGPQPVGTYNQNISPYGAVEMAGNVWQWTSDWYSPSYYEESPCDNPMGPQEGDVRVLRGGAWYYSLDALSVTYRNTWAPTFTFLGSYFGDYRGFGVRCVKPSPETPCDPETALCDLPSECSEEPPKDVVEPEDSVEDADILESSDVEIVEVPDVVEEDVMASDSMGPQDGDGSSIADAEPEEDSEQEDGGSDVEEVCSNPQDAEPPDLSLCYDPIPGLCPSGWGDGCSPKACHCSIGVTTDPGTCGDELMTVVAAWRDVNKNVFPFQEGQPMEICEGFQGGVHLATVVQADAPQMTGDFFYSDIYIRLKIGDVVVGSFSEENVKLERNVDGVFESKLQQIRFEGCLGDAYAGENVFLELLIRDKDDHWGSSSVTIPMVNQVEGPYLDPGNVNPC